jgi:hypothetical protein
MEEAGESRGGRLGERVILTRRGTVRRLCPHPLLHYCQYVPLDCALGSVSGAKPRIPFQLRGKEKGRGNDVEPTCQRHQRNCDTFSISIYCFITWLRRHIQPSTLKLIASSNFNPRRQLHPSSTSILLANFIPRHQLKPSSLPTSTPSRMCPFSIFRTFAVKSAAPSSASATPMRYYCKCRCVIFMRRARISMSGRALSGASARPIIRRHCASRGWRGS